MKKLLFSLLIFCCIARITSATHLRAGQITVHQLPGEERTCLIKVTVYTNTNSSVLFGGRNDEEDILNFGDGQSMLIPEQHNEIRFDLGMYIGMASFEVVHTFPSYGSFLISYSEPNRNEGILNMSNSTNMRFYTETFITLSPGELYETPTPLLDPIFHGVVHFDYSESLACTDANNYTLYYQLITPQQSRHESVLNYKFPENISLDPISGLLTWDTEFQGFYPAGEFSFAVRILQIKDNRIVGYIVRDFQLILTDSMDEEPLLEGSEMQNERTYIPEDNTLELTVVAGSSSTSDIALEIFSELDEFPDNFSYTVKDSVHNDTTLKVAKLSITNDEAVIRDNPYLIVARAKFDHKTRKDLTFIIATKDILFELPLILGTEETPGDPLSLAPNPVRNFVQINNDEKRSITMRILDLQGKTLCEEMIHETRLVDLRTLPVGLYICTLTTNGKRTAYRIIKEQE